MNNFSNEKLDAITNEAFNGFNESLIKQHWMTLIGTPMLLENETVRLVIMPSATSSLMKAGKVVTGGWADTLQIRSPEELIRRMTEMQGTDVPGSVGFALSAGVYNYIPNKSPGISSLKYIQNLIIDVDAHPHEATKDRFNLTVVRPDYLKYSAIITLNYINDLLFANGIPPVTPVYTAMTGGGFQYGVRFDKALDSDDAKKVFDAFGSVLGMNHANALSKVEEQNQNEVDEKVIDKAQLEQEQNKAALLNNTIEASDLDVIKKKKGISVKVKSFFGEWFTPFMELDNTFKDISHAQRVPGTINQKYASFAYIDNDLVSGKDLDEMVMTFEQEIYSDPLMNDDLKNKFVIHYKRVVQLFKTTILNKNPDNLIIPQPSESIKALSGIIQYANSKERVQGIEFITLTEAEKQILTALGAKEMVKEVLNDLGIDIVKDSSSYIACRSPFRTDSKPSLAVYLNHNRANIKDFTEEKYYNLITLWMEVNKVTKTEAIESMAYKYNIKIDKSDKRELAKLQTSESVFDLIKLVNTQDFVYYRLADATKRCIIKNIKTGKSRTFDGYKTLADHILMYQLGIKNPEEEYRKAFEEACLQYVIIDAFEDFLPGGQKVYEEDYIQHVNIWSTSDNYLKCWAESESLAEMNVEEAIDLIKEVCPTIYIYLLQITQKGDLAYFVNWLNTLAKFHYGPVIPIFTSVEGAGKNLFANKILAPYINKNYIATVNGNAIQSNFNSFMGHTNLIIADEGDFTGSREFDQLKMLSGNDTVRVEKKGVDAQTMDRRFNLCMFTNGSEPVRHPITDRRCVYFKLEHTLEATLTKLKIASVNEFVKKIDQEVFKFWGIIIKTKLNDIWANHNIRNGQYHNQILLMHPFGKLVLKMINNQWSEISLQLNEKQKELQDEKTNMMLLQDIQAKFFNGEPLPLITINKYLDAMSWKSSTSIQEFISRNKLNEHGVEIIVDFDSIKIKLDAEKLQKFIFQENNLSEIIPEFAVQKVKTLSELAEELESEKKIILDKNTPTNQFANKHPMPGSVGSPNTLGSIVTPSFGSSGPGSNIPPINLPGGVPGMAGVPAGIPGGLPTANLTSITETKKD